MGFQLFAKWKRGKNNPESSNEENGLPKIITEMTETFWFIEIEGLRNITIVCATQAHMTERDIPKHNGKAN